MNDDSSVVIVKHPFVHRWIDQLVSELDDTKKMWIFVHPYAEDLPLEPAGLYSYVYPLILDSFITSRDSGSRKGGRKNGSYKQTPQSAGIPADADHLFRLMGCKPALKNNGKEVTAWAYPFMNERSREFFHFACLLFPLAVALDQKEKFSEKLQESKNLSSTDRRIFEVLLGERS